MPTPSVSNQAPSLDFLDGKLSSRGEDKKDTQRAKDHLGLFKANSMMVA